MKDNVTAGENQLIVINRCILIGKSVTNNDNLLIYNKIIARRFDIYTIIVKINIRMKFELIINGKLPNERHPSNAVNRIYFIRQTVYVK